VPVAMSNIPAFIEHIEVFGVRAQMFNPKNSSDIADKIQNILMNKELALEDAKISQASIKNLTWDNVAEKYIKIFMDTIK
jgi:glycosyltransferase involved in cell wall biosynthesis